MKNSHCLRYPKRGSRGYNYKGRGKRGRRKVYERMKETKTNWVGIDPNPKDNFGFVYKVHDPTTGKFYIGRKVYWSVKPVKQRRHKRPENDPESKYFHENFRPSDWQEYKTSSRNKEFQKLVKESEEDLIWEIIANCKTKGLLNFMENFFITMESSFLTSQLCYNGHIGKLYKPSEEIAKEIRERITIINE